jgi:DNA topoisomerase I
MIRFVDRRRCPIQFVANCTPFWNAATPLFTDMIELCLHFCRCGHLEGVMALVNQNPSVFDDDDDAPVSFKRSSNSVKSRPTPLRQEGASGNAVPVRNPKPVASKNGVTSPPRHLHVKPQSSSLDHRHSRSSQPNSSRNNNTNSSKLKRTYVKDEQPDDSDDDDVPIGLRKKGEEKKLKRVDAGGDKAGDSDGDHKPLTLKMNSIKTPSRSKDKAPVQKAAPKLERPDDDDDSDDDKPLASRLPTNAAPKSGGDASDSEDEKPLSSRFPKVTGSASLKSGSSNNVTNGPQSLGKRPLVSSTQTSSALKKAKPSGVSASAIVKKESKVDDNDNVPLAQRLKIGESSKSKTSVKAIVKKSPASLKNSKKMKTKVKTKQPIRKSQFSKTLKAPPGSDGGKKWTTLEHNGVIFPPPYKPHGVKMLYNGKPVDLTPEQEEVINGALALFLFFLQVWICNNNIIIQTWFLKLNHAS